MNQGTHFSGQPILAQLLKLVPRVEVQRLAREHGADRYYKKFKTYEHLVAMLYATLASCTSLREVVTGMLACDRRLGHLAISHAPRRSTLADANCKRDCEVFAAIYRFLYRRYASFLPDSRSKRWRSKLFIVDSTTISLFQEILKNSGRSPLTGKRKGGVKAHTLMKADEDVPRVVCFTSGAAHDRVFMKKIAVPAGSIIVFDRAYLDYGLFKRWKREGTTVVTRLVKNQILTEEQERPVSDSARSVGVLSDTKVLLGHKRQRNKVQARVIRFCDAATGRHFEFVTTNFRLGPATIAQIYRQRWQIETFFKRIKQNYPLRYFLGDNANAIKIQIWCAVIADLLLKLVRKQCKRPWAFANLASMVRIHLMTYIDLMSFLQNPEKALKAQYPQQEKPREWSLFPT